VVITPLFVPRGAPRRHSQRVESSAVGESKV